jgi:hypothetical protein
LKELKRVEFQQMGYVLFENTGHYEVILFINEEVFRSADFNTLEDAEVFFNIFECLAYKYNKLT